MKLLGEYIHLAFIVALSGILVLVAKYYEVDMEFFQATILLSISIKVFRDIGETR